MRRSISFRVEQSFVKRPVGRFLAVPALVGALLWVASPLLSGPKPPSSSGSSISQLQLQVFSRRHLQSIHLALTQYAADYDGRLPALDQPAKLKKQLVSYRFSGGNLICPVSNQPYRFNKNLAGKKLDDLPDSSNTLLAWSPRALADGNTMVLTASGLSKRVSSAELAKMKRISHVQ